MRSQFSQEMPQLTPSVWKNGRGEWVGVGSIRIACLSNKKIIINLNFYLWHEILIDFSYAGRLRDISEKNEIQQAGEIAKVSQYFMP